MTQLTKLLTVVALLCAVAPPAAACSKFPAWQHTGERQVTFIGIAQLDTVLTGAGPVEYVAAGGHRGPGTTGPILGQVVRVQRLTARAQALLPAGTTRVIIVPWDYDAGCSPVRWTGSWQWAPVEVRGLFRGTLRPREHWVDGVPTLDEHTPEHSPYPMRGSTLRGLPGSAPALPLDTVFALIDELPDLRAARSDTMIAAAWYQRMLARSEHRRVFPMPEFEGLARDALVRARMAALGTPFAGTFRVQLTFPDSTTRELFLRAARSFISYSFRATDAAERRGGMTAAVPESYNVYVGTATSLAELPSSCQWVRGKLGYVSVAWHPTYRPDAVGRWALRVEAGALAPALSDSERRSLDTQATDAFSDPSRLIEHPIRLEHRSADGPLVLTGEINIPGTGVVRISGERITNDVLPCSL